MYGLYACILQSHSTSFEELVCFSSLVDSFFIIHRNLRIVQIKQEFGYHDKMMQNSSKQKNMLNPVVNFSYINFKGVKGKIS